MRKSIIFFKTLILSFISPHYYATLLKKPLSFSFQYYFVFQLFFALLATTYIALRFFLPYRDFVEHLPENIVQLYPDELIVSINNGQVSTNVHEPYHIPSSVVYPLMNTLEQVSTSSAHRDFENILIIDTHATAENMHNYQTWSLLSWDSFMYRQNNHIETIPLTTIQNTTISEETAQSLSIQLQPFSRHMVHILSLFVFMGIFMEGVSRLTSILLASVFLGLLVRLLRKKLPWSKSFQLILHTAPLIQTIVAILWITHTYYWFPFMNMVLNIIAGIGVILSLRGSNILNTKSPS